jgi:hypothetical protein
MMDETPILVVEVVGGRALPEVIRMQMGHPLQPVSFGSKGQWHVTGPGVRELHGYLKFDGTHPYVRSAESEFALRINGAPIGVEWEQVTPPCRIAAGNATLAFAATAAAPLHDTIVMDQPIASSLETTRIEPLEPSGHPSSQLATTIIDTTRRGVVPEDLGSTQIDVTSPIPAQRAPKAVVGRALPIDVPPSPPSVSAPARSRALEVLRENWVNATLPQKTTILLLPLAFFAVHVLFGGPDKPIEGRTTPPSAAPSSAPVLEPSAASSAAASTPSTAPVQPAAPMTSGKTAARLAADAFAAGAYIDAVRRYDALAQQNPDQPVYREAARILRSKLDASAP